jgi:hypothetical protein
MNQGNMPVIQQYLAANPYQAPQATSTAPAHQSGNFLTHLFPTLGGTLGGVAGGALGGSEIGTALLPGVGTAAGGLLGALLGGALGGAGGKVAENNAEKQKLTNGVAGQALEQGALSAGPLRLLKGLGAAGSVTGEAAANLGEKSAGQTLVDALNAAGGAATKSGKVASAVQGAKQVVADKSASGFGTGVGQTINGKVLTPNDAKALNDFLQNRAPLYEGATPGSKGITAGTPISQAADAQAVHNNVTQALQDQLGTINRAVTPQDTAGIAAAMRTAATGNPALAGSSLAPLSALAQQVTGATDIKGLEAARMAADKLAYTNGTDVGSSQLAQQGAHARDAIDAYVSKVPAGATPEQAAAINEYKAIKGDYGASKDLVSATSSANGAADANGGIHLPIVGNVGGQAVGGATNKLAAAASGKLAGGVANPYSAKAIATRVGGTGTLLDALTNARQSATQGATAQSPADLTAAINQATQQQAGTPDQTTQDNSPFSQANIENAIANDIATTGGKNISQLVSLYNTFGKPDAAASALTTNQKNEVVSQQKAAEALNAYMGLLQQAGGAEGPIKGAIDSSIIGGYTNPAAQAMDKQRIDIASAIAGSLNPRGTVSPTVARTIAESLPSIHDTPQAQAMKLQSLMAQIKSGAYSATTPVSSIVSSGNG